MSEATVLARGALAQMRSALDTPVRYTLDVGGTSVPLNDLLGREVTLRFVGRITCQNCGAVTRKSYGDGYCYDCFKTLARCDLCVVSPDRCHYAAGTCREPEWGDAFCMQPHWVYLANSAGPKVGITRPQNVPTRWLDQGATQGMLVMRTRTRHQAGCVEAALARYVPDRTDWRGLIGRDAPPIDLVDLLVQLRDRARLELATLAGRFPAALEWIDSPTPQRFEYPVSSYDGSATVLALVADAAIGGTLLGIKGQYLLFDTGVLNVRRFTSYHVELAHAEPVERPGAVATGVRDQIELF
ncbi:MAG TPA: DUF2797 domain-containing protein [Pseudomonadales bacterium]|nr:DUF2797 domain-containing protein [Pseudomonadales bacterium]